MLEKLTTESRNPASEAIDSLSAVEIVRLMNAEDAGVASAVALESDRIAQAIDVIADRLRNGGRLIYIGAGTSGRLGVLDAAECPPTFNTRPEMVLGLIAGGPTALTRAVEGAEDHPEFAVTDLDAVGLSERDVVVGIASSGRTPYVIGGLRHARGKRAFAIGFSCNPEPELAAIADLTIAPVVGPEVVSGSTRLKSGTATKMVLNMLTTGAMVRLGKTYGNLMVDLRATNKKLLERTRRIVMMLTGITVEAADALLKDAGGELKTAVVMQRRGVSREEACRLLDRSGGHLRLALAESATAQQASASPDAQSTAPDSTNIRLSPSPQLSVSPSSPLLALGIDGGGSKTLAWLSRRTVSEDWTIVGRGVAGPSNPQAIGFSAALASLDRAIDAAFRDAGLPVQPVTAVCAALAGAGRDADRARIEDWARDRSLTGRLDLVHDALPLLAAGTPEGWGVALIAGTGSSAFGRNARGEMARAGGWGYLMGDEGSGYAIARQALQAAAQAADGRGSETRLLPRFLQLLDVQQPFELIQKIHGGEIDRAMIATWADVVFDEAARGDEVAVQIVFTAARELAAAVASVCRQLRMDAIPFPLALSGGLLIHQANYRDALERELQQMGLKPAPVQIVAEPVSGAMLLAQRAASASIRV